VQCWAVYLRLVDADPVLGPSEINDWGTVPAAVFTGKKEEAADWGDRFVAQAETHMEYKVVQCDADLPTQPAADHTVAWVRGQRLGREVVLGSWPGGSAELRPFARDPGGRVLSWEVYITRREETQVMAGEIVHGDIAEAYKVVQDYAGGHWR
jgi:hypothetical protein